MRALESNAPWLSVTDYRLYPAIQAQPSECAKLLSSVQPFDRAAQTLSEATRVWTVGIGTSYNAANAASWMLRAAGLEARPLTSFEFATWPTVAEGDAVLLFAHTGRKTYSGNSLDLCIERGIPTVLITKIETGFDLDSFPDSVTVLHTTTQDPSSMYTISHTTAMTAAAKIADLVSPGALGDIAEIPSALGVGAQAGRRDRRTRSGVVDGSADRAGCRTDADRRRGGAHQDRRGLASGGASPGA